jgi:hypothetical protein
MRPMNKFFSPVCGWYAESYNFLAAHTSSSEVPFGSVPALYALTSCAALSKSELRRRSEVSKPVVERSIALGQVKYLADFWNTFVGCKYRTGIGDLHIVLGAPPVRRLIVPWLIEVDAAC